MTMHVNLIVPKKLFEQIEAAARATHQPTTVFMREVLEADVASRRLQILPPPDTREREAVRLRVASHRERQKNRHLVAGV